MTITGRHTVHVERPKCRGASRSVFATASQRSARFLESSPRRRRFFRSLSFFRFTPKHPAVTTTTLRQEALQQRPLDTAPLLVALTTSAGSFRRPVWVDFFRQRGTLHYCTPPCTGVDSTRNNLRIRVRDSARREPGR